MTSGDSQKLPVGTLVRIIPEQTRDESNIVAQHGTLWVRTEAEVADSDTVLYWYRSLATGFEHLWYDHEVETREHNDAET